MEISLSEIAAILAFSGRVAGRTVRGVSIDSRTIEPGELFFAIRGPRYDGHDFVEKAMGRGAAGAVVEGEFLGRAPADLVPALIPVPNTLEALQKFGGEVRRGWGRRLVAVTGSTGKTTTKEMIAALLETRLRVLKTSGNLNNDYGLPLTLLRLGPSDQAAVVELAMSTPGEIARLARIAQPSVGVVTNVAPVHLQAFDSVDSIARAKRELIENLSPPRTAVLSNDDPRVRRFREGFDGQVVSFGFEEGADFRAVEMAAASVGTRFRLLARPLQGEFYLPLPGRHNVLNALAALATASLFDIPGEDCREALAQFANLAQRSEILTFPDGLIVINDTYNSNPLAMSRMLETLAAWEVEGRRIVVAGEMLELGPTSPDWHREIGQKASQAGVDWLVAVQGDARWFLQGASKSGFPGERLRFFPSAESAAEFVAGLVRPGDVVLVKGSRAVHLERVVEFLKSREWSEQPGTRQAG